jgi:branched-chain amino acid transport system permease protein
MSQIVTALLAATFISALYAIIAIGFTLIFGVGGILNFAHGAFITVGAFAAFFVSSSSGLGLPIIFGLLAATLAGAAVGGVTYLGVIRYVRTRPVTILILTLVIGFFIMYALNIFTDEIMGVDPLQIPVPPVIGTESAINGAISFIGPSTLNSLFIFTTSWLLIGALYYFVNSTRTGRAILAVSMSDKGAALVGINAEKINLITWVLAGAFAGYAGVLLAGDLGGGSWLMAIEPPAPLVLSFAIVILGGLGSIKGSVVGAYIIGFFETFTVTFVSSQLAGISSLILLLVFLLAKPEGLYGREAAE